MMSRISLINDFFQSSTADNQVAKLCEPCTFAVKIALMLMLSEFALIVQTPVTSFMSNEEISEV